MVMSVSTLERFYSTPLGGWVSFTLGKKIATCWKPRRQERTLGVGYPIPYMPFLKNLPETIPIFMFQSQNAHSWPTSAKNRVILGCEDFFPFSDGQFDKAFMVHGLEGAMEPTKLLREIWRILKPEGELLLIIPTPYTSFLHGKESPWRQTWLSVSQVMPLLKNTCFVVLDKKKALFTPLSTLGFWGAPLWESMGDLGIWPFAGVWLIRAQKQVYQAALPPEKALCKAHVILVEEGN